MINEMRGMGVTQDVPPNPKKAFDEAMKMQDKWPQKYKDAVIDLTSEFNNRLKAAKEAQWKADTKKTIDSSNGRLSAMDNSLSTEEMQKHVVLAVEKVGQMIKEDEYRKGKTDSSDRLSVKEL
jgi:hypothetical protein